MPSGTIEEVRAARRRRGRAVRRAGPAGIGRQHAGDALEERGLAGAVRADQPEHFAVANLEGDVVERGDRDRIVWRVL